MTLVSSFVSSLVRQFVRQFVFSELALNDLSDFGPELSSFRSQEMTSVSPLVSLLVSFLRIGSLDFSDFLHEVRGPQMQKSDGALFLKKKSLVPFFGQKMPKNEVFRTLRKIESLNFSDFGPELSSFGSQEMTLVSQLVSQFSQDWLIRFF